MIESEMREKLLQLAKENNFLVEIGNIKKVLKWIMNLW